MSATIKIPQEDIGRVIGKGGSFIRGFKDAYGCNINIDQNLDRDGMATVSIDGDQRSAEDTKALIEGHLSGDQPFRPPHDDYGGGGGGGYGGRGGGGGYGGGGGGGYGGGRGRGGGGGRGGGCFKCGQDGHFARECPNEDGGGGGGGYGGGGGRYGGGGGGRRDY